MTFDSIRSFAKPLAAWLLLAAAVSALGPVPIALTISVTVLATAVLIALGAKSWLDIAWYGGLVVLLAIAFTFPLPIPESVPSAPRLGIVIGFWGLLATIGTAAILLRHE